MIVLKTDSKKNFLMYIEKSFEIMTNEQIVIAILVLIVLVLAYYVWVYRSTCALVKGELGQDLNDLEVLLQDVKVEHFQDVAELNLQSRRDRIEAKLQKIQALRAAGKLKLDAAQEARLRRAVAEGNDFLATTYKGQDEETVKLVRRIRDIMLFVIKKSKAVKKFNCDRLLQWRNEKSRYKGLVNSMNMVGGYGQLAMLDNILPELQKLSDADVSKRPEFFADPASAVPVQATQTVPVQPTNEAPAKTSEGLSDDEKKLLLQFYWSLDSAICGSQAQSFNRARGDADGIVNETKKGQMEAVTKEEVLNVIDGMEQLLLHVQKKLCPNGQLDRKKIYEVYQRVLTLLCDNDEFAMSLISQPLEVALTKSLSLFE